MKRTMILLLATATSILMWQCGKDDDNNVKTFALSSTAWNEVTVAGGADTITLEAPADWTVMINYAEGSNWLSLNNLYGSSGRYTLIVTAQRNQSYDSRSATITVLCGQQTKTISVKQDGREGFQIASAEQLQALQARDTTVTITVNSNITYHYTIPTQATWITAATGKGLTASTVSFHVAANTTIAERSAIVTFYANSGEDVDVLFRQAAAAAE